MKEEIITVENDDYSHLSIECESCGGRHCKYCFEVHDYTEEECWDKIFIYPHILYISTAVGEWTHPSAESMIFDNMFNLDDVNSELEEEKKTYETISGNLLRISAQVKRKNIQIVFAVNDEAIENQLEFGPLNPRMLNTTVKQTPTSNMLLFGQIFGWQLQSNCDWRPSIGLFRNSVYGKKFFKRFGEIDLSDVKINIFSPDVVLHFDADNSQFVGFST